MRNSLILVLFGSLTMLAGCGGSSGSSSNSSGNNSGSNPASGANVQPISVNSGPQGNYVNGVFTNVTVCVPGSSNCQTISGVLVDTGSFGLRILSSALSVSLPQQTSGSTKIAECAFFADTVTWGSVRTADIKLSGEVAGSVPIQVIGDSAFPTVPTTCLKHSPNGRASDDLQSLFANGILGIGPLQQDCGPDCALPLTSTNPSNPQNYYVCPTASSCTPTVQPVNMQVQNPVSMFPVDNNGTIVKLPAVPATGAPTVTGSLVFGIGTQSNNGLGSASVFTPNANGALTTVYPVNGTSMPNSFIDSGSNGLFFGSPTSSLPRCPSSGSTPSGFYCPTSTQNLSATLQGGNSTTTTNKFSVADANAFPANNFAFNDLGGPSSDPTSFDWGLPFFFGRNVFTAIDSQNTPSGPGPYWAY